METARRQNHYCERLLGKLLNQNFKEIMFLAKFIVSKLVDNPGGSTS